MNLKMLVPLAFFFLLGLFFIGAGVNGFVVSQSCCFPPNCSVENLCDNARISFGSSQAAAFAALIGFAISVLSLFIFRLLLKKSDY